MGKLIIISGPSGVGKTSICKALCERNQNISWSVSATTRPIRSGEVDGKDYFFLTEKEFLKKIDQEEFLEYAQVHGHYYGTPKKKVYEVLQHSNFLMDIDVQGAKQIRQNSEFPSVFVFIAPPDLESLKKRLEIRGSNRAEDIKTRMDNVEKEMAESKFYDHYIQNVDLDKTIDTVQRIVESAISSEI